LVLLPVQAAIFLLAEAGLFLVCCQNLALKDVHLDRFAAAWG
jgi:hypothetical protein